MPYKAKPLEERFWSKVDKSGGPDACWPWTDKLLKSGYGKFFVARGQSPAIASRLSLQMTGVDLTGLEARHTCDNPPCVNPAHLEPGTHAQNMADMARRNRQRAIRKGELHPEARLAAEQVVEMREQAARGAKLRALAEIYGIDESHVAKICRGEKWKSVGGPRSRKYTTRKKINHGE